MWSLQAHRALLTRNPSRRAYRRSRERGLCASRLGRAAWTLLLLHPRRLPHHARTRAWVNAQDRRSSPSEYTEVSLRLIACSRTRGHKSLYA
eukprot:6205232-Pleurochrysis_carterae.AAC.4